MLPPNHALRRFEVAGEPRRRIPLHRMKRKAAGRVCWAAHESHCNRRGRRGCNGFARARSLSPAGLLPSVEFLSPFPKRLKWCVPCAGSLRVGR
jgi:hypothetical protein